MASSGETSTVMKYITNGASDFLIKPVRMEELKNIWQHVFRKQIGEHKRNNATCGSRELLYRPPTVAPSPGAARTTGIFKAAAILEREVRDIQDLKKSRLSWTMQLHRQFIAAVNFLGADKAVPKKIMETMKVKHLTREQVSSHLQRYRMHLRKSTPTMRKGGATPSSSDAIRSNIPKTRNCSSISMYFDQDGCMEIKDYYLPKDDLSSGSECKLGEQNNPQDYFNDFIWDSGKHVSESYFWNFEAE